MLNKIVLILALIAFCALPYTLAELFENSTSVQPSINDGQNANQGNAQSPQITTTSDSNSSAYCHGAPYDCKQKKSATDWPIFIVLIVQTFVFIGQGWIFWRQSRQLEKTVELGQIELRSFVSVDVNDVEISTPTINTYNLVVYPVNQCLFRANLTISNLGRTAAVKFRYRAVAKICNGNKPDFKQLPKEYKKLPDLIINKDSTISFSEEFTKKEMEDLGFNVKGSFEIVWARNSGLGRLVPLGAAFQSLYFYGQFDFTDIFNNDWRTEFCFQILEVGGDPILNRTADHNDTNPRPKTA